MADGSEISGAFWLLDSGASRHFTGDLGDFASYQALKHKHYAKMANGVAEIAGIGMVLLRCLVSETVPLTNSDEAEEGGGAYASAECLRTLA